MCLAQSTQEALLGGMGVPDLLRFDLNFGSVAPAAARACKSVSKPTALASSLDARFRYVRRPPPKFPFRSRVSTDPLAFKVSQLAKC